MSVASRLLSLYEGFSQAHGRYKVLGSKTPKGKAEGRAITVREPVTEDLWEQHLRATGSGLGIIPLRDDNTCVWGAIDIDVYNLDLNDLEQKINKFKFPLIVCRTKSGGAHLYCFFSEPVPADMLIAKLNEWSAALGHGGCEIFPKQTTRHNFDEDIGNWINMPYYDSDKTMRYAIKEGKALDVEEFIDYATERQFTYEMLVEIVPHHCPVGDGELLYEAPPCLTSIAAAGGFPEGTRNNGMAAVVTYLKKRYPDDWQNRVHDYNNSVLLPDPLAYGEIDVIIKSFQKKNYEYKCKDMPIKQFCNRSKCLNMKFGVGDAGTGASAVEITQITKYLGDPVIWYVEVEGKRLRMGTDKLINQKEFNKLVLERLNKLPGTLPTVRWERYIGEKVQGADIIDAPEETTELGVFRTIFTQYLQNQNRATSLEEVLRNVVFKDEEGFFVWRAVSLTNYLRAQGYKFESAHHVWQLVRELGGTNDQKWIPNHGNVKVWRIKFEIDNARDPTPEIEGAPF